MGLSIIQNTIIEIIDWFYKPFNKYIPMPEQTFRYAFCGGSNMALNNFLYFITYNFVLKKEIVDFGFVAISPHIAAFLFVFPITFIIGFLLLKYITFSQSYLKGRIQLFRYGLSVAGSLLLHYIILKFFVEYCGFYPTPSQMLTTGIVIIYSYMMQKHFSFRTAKEKS